jgi:CheY-like chemotaxis protein
MKILLADDDEDQLALRGMLLRRSGFETMEATDFPSAIQLARAQKPECAIVDLRFPTDEIGYQLIRELKALNSSMHVFLLTGGDPARCSQRRETDLVEEVVVKGSSSAHLIQKLKALASGL